MNKLEHKIPPPITALLIAGLMWALAGMGPVWSVAGGARLMAAGVVGIAALASGVLGARELRRARTTINPVQPDLASSVVTTGIYRYTRNPMYVGLAGALLCWAILLVAPWVLLGPLGFMLFTTRFQIMPEERILQEKFGDKYTDYLHRVRRWC